MNAAGPRPAKHKLNNTEQQKIFIFGFRSAEHQPVLAARKRPHASKSSRPDVSMQVVRVVFEVDKAVPIVDPYLERSQHRKSQKSRDLSTNGTALLCGIERDHVLVLMSQISEPKR